MRGETLRLFDSHCHLDMEEFRGEVDGVLENAYAAGVRRLLLVSCDEPSSREVLYLASKKTGKSNIEIWTAVGVHPHEASSVASGLPEELTDLAENENVVALGEMGLDFYYDHSPRETQEKVFASQIEWAVRAGKPIVVHLRNATDRRTGDAYARAVGIMKESGAERCGGVIHCFSGDKSDARTALDLGFYISFAGPLTYPRADELRKVASYVPLDRTLCETDSPYLAPQSHRGKRNSPEYVCEVYRRLAELRELPFGELAGAIWRNGETLFKGKAH